MMDVKQNRINRLGYKNAIAVRNGVYSFFSRAEKQSESEGIRSSLSFSLTLENNLEELLKRAEVNRISFRIRRQLLPLLLPGNFEKQKIQDSPWNLRPTGA